MKRYTLILIVILLSASAVFAQDRADQSKITSAIEKYHDEIIQIRRTIHQNPELPNREFETAALVSEHLKKLGIEVYENVAHTGVVGILNGRNPGRVVALRGDMDALPIQEETDLPFKSQNDGVMHACGHDFHTAILLGAAKVLSELKNDFDGTVKFLFQPAEEGAPAGEEGGARLMIKENVLQNPAPEVIFGLHSGIGEGPGGISYNPGGTLASADGFKIVIKGKGTHAASPWAGKDPIVTASQVVMGLQNIRSRMTDTRKPLVISIGTIQGGTRSNIIPEEVTMTGTVRTHHPEMRQQAKPLMEQVIAGICQSYGCEYDFSYRYGAPVTFNNHDLTAWSVGILNDVLGADNVMLTEPHMGAEDFSFYAQKIPAFFYFLNCGAPEDGYIYPHHNPKFMLDEGAIPVGIRSLVTLAVNFLESNEEFELEYKSAPKKKMKKKKK